MPVAAIDMGGLSVVCQLVNKKMFLISSCISSFLSRIFQ